MSANEGSAYLSAFPLLPADPPTCTSSMTMNTAMDKNRNLMITDCTKFNSICKYSVETKAIAKSDT